MSDKVEVTCAWIVPSGETGTKGRPAEPPERVVRRVLISKSLFSRGSNILICQKLVFAFYFYLTWVAGASQDVKYSVDFTLALLLLKLPTFPSI